MMAADRPEARAAGDARRPCRVGERAFVPGRNREVKVEDICGARVRCVWEQDGIRRSTWVAADQLESPRDPTPS